MGTHKRKKGRPRSNRWKSCKHVPCGSSMSHCKPSYCHPGESKNWGLYNIKNLYPNKSKLYKHLKKHCTKVIKSVSNNIPKFQVKTRKLHRKLPYIWRQLKPETRKKMIVMANLPVNVINTWASASGKYIKRNKKLKKLFKKYNIPYYNASKDSQLQKKN